MPGKVTLTADVAWSVQVVTNWMPGEDQGGVEFIAREARLVAEYPDGQCVSALVRDVKITANLAALEHKHHGAASDESFPRPEGDT